MIKKYWFSTLLAFIFVVFACTSDDDTVIVTDNNPIDEEPPVVVEESIKYLALGDSYTIGQGVEEAERWPNQLVQELQTNDFIVDDFDIIAQTGWRTNDLINAIDANDPQDFNLVSLLIGVNNQFNGLDFDIFTTEFNALVQKTISIAGERNRIFVVSIPDYGVTPFGNSWGDPEQIASELDMYNNYMSESCSGLGIPFINITEISRSLGDSEGTLSDGLHPSGFQYNLWVEEILLVVLEMI